jgi:hypothetical protein
MRPTPILTAALLAAAALAAPAQAATVSPAGVRFPQVAVNAGGAMVVAWERRTKDAFAVEARAGAGPRQLGPTRRLAARGYRPCVAIGADGTRAVQWMEYAGDRIQEIRVAVARPGHGFGKAQLLERRRGTLAPAGIAVQSNGRVVAIWQRGSSRLVFALAPRNHGFGAARYLTFTAPSSGETIAVDPRDGAVVLAYGTPLSIAQLTNQQAAVRTLATTSAAFSEQAILSDPAGLAEAQPVVAAGSGGAGVLFTRSGNVRELFLVRRTTTGTWAPPQLVATPTSADGRFAVEPIGTLPADGSALVSLSVVDDPDGSGARSRQTVASIAAPAASFGVPVALTRAGETYAARAIASSGAEAFVATAKAHGPVLLATKRPAAASLGAPATLARDGDGDILLAAGGSHVLAAWQRNDRLVVHTVR